MIESQALYHMAGVSATQPVPVCFAGDAGAQPPGLAGHRPGSGEAPPGLGAGRVGWARLLGPHRGRPFLPFLLFLLPRDITAPLPLEQPRTAAARQHRLAPRTARFGSTGTDPPPGAPMRGDALAWARVLIREAVDTRAHAQVHARALAHL